MSIRILTDLHHSVLYESFAMLFVDRAIFGPAELVAWVDGHYQPGGSAPEEFGRTPRVVDTGWLEGNRPDIVISTVDGTRERMKRLAGDLGALYVDHMGNPWDTPLGDVILWTKSGQGPGITYHPEFHRDESLPARSRIGAFHTSFVTLPCRALWDEAERHHPEFEWVLYGTTEHPLRPHQVAPARSECIAQWVCKDQDGYGFCVHEAFASGRAVIGHASHYAGKLAEPLFVRGETYLEPGDPLQDLDALGARAKAHFDALVDFDAEAIAVRDYLAARL